MSDKWERNKDLSDCKPLHCATFNRWRDAILMGVLGGIASFISPPHHGLIKAGIGIIVGAILLGNKLPSAIKELWGIIDESTDDIFQ